MVERLAIGIGDKETISADDVSEVVNEIRRFEMPSEIPLGFREDDSLDSFLARSALVSITISGQPREITRRSPDSRYP